MAAIDYGVIAFKNGHLITGIHCRDYHGGTAERSLT